MKSLLFSSFLVQGFAMFFDEFYFHRKRGLPLWEKIGHPLDTLSVLICYLYLLFYEYSETHFVVYVGLCAFSCLLITKDEFIHTGRCEPRENWLHALLFVVHPVAFVAAAFLWWQSFNENFFKFQAVIIFIFMVYQVTYWGFYDKRRS